MKSGNLTFSEVSILQLAMPFTPEMLFFRKKVTAIRLLFVYLQQNKQKNNYTFISSMGTPGLQGNNSELGTSHHSLTVQALPPASWVPTNQTRLLFFYY